VGARFSAPVLTGFVAYTASYTMGTGSFPGIKLSGPVVDDPPHLAPRLKEEWALLLLKFWDFVPSSRVKFYFIIIIIIIILYNINICYL